MNKPTVFVVKTDYNYLYRCTNFDEIEYLEGLRQSLADYGDPGIYTPLISLMEIQTIFKQ